MGFSIGNLFKSAVSFLKPMAETALKAVTPQVTNLLKGIVDSGKSAFDGIKNAATSMVSRLPLIGDLASKLLGSGFDKLGNLGMDAIQKYISELLGKLAPRDVPGTTGTVTTPTLDTRAATAAAEAARVAAAAGVSGAAGATGAASAAATGATGTAARAATGGGKNIEDAVMDGSAFNNVPAEPTIDGTEDEKTLAKKQAQLQKYARMMQAITAFLQASHEMKKGIIQNFRV